MNGRIQICLNIMASDYPASLASWPEKQLNLNAQTNLSSDIGCVLLYEEKLTAVAVG